MVGSAHSTPYRRSMSCSRSWTRSAPRPGGVVGPALACAGSWFRPSAVGSLRVWPSDPAGHTDALSARLHVFAQAGWLALADVYTEHTDVPAFREGAAFRALVDKLGHHAEHFWWLRGMYRARCTTIAAETGADMLIMSQRGGGAS